MHEDIANKILLAQSGELPAGEWNELRKHLAGCEDCRRYREDIDQIAAWAGQALPVGSPSPAVSRAIRMEAERRAKPEPILRFARSAARVLACAAALMLLLAGWHTLTAGRHAERIHEIDAILAIADADDPMPVPVADIQAATGREEKLRTLARQLLQMEGLGNESEPSLLEI
ncbi:MAG: hypothetical protein QME60_07060 [Verrucomicrobiota bacterium]|nr:hypothetical protein [Verrucomicrobiota bacterium]